MGRLRGCIWLSAGLVVALLAGIVGYIALTRAVAQGGAGVAPGAPEVQVVTANQAIKVRSILTEKDVSLRRMPVNVVPEGALRDAKAAVGKIVMVDLYSGEVILQQRLVDPNVIAADGRTAVALASDQVLMAFPADDLLSRSNLLKPGDHIDLLFSLKFKLAQPAALRPSSSEFPTGTGAVSGGQTEQLATFDVLQNGVISAIVAGKTPTGGADPQAPQAILLTLSPQDALILKYVKDAGGILDAVVRAPGAERPFTVEPVDQDYVMRKFRILLGGQ